MSIPNELWYKIISFVPHGYFKAVCKEWNTEIKNIQKESVGTIENWYRKVQENPTTVKELVRCLIVYCPPEFFIVYPEFAVRKLGLNETLLSLIPPLETRKRSDVRDWILNMPILLEDWSYIGW